MARRERGQVSCTRLERRNSENSPRIGIRESCFAPERGPGTHAVLRIHCRHQRVSACERESVCVAGNRVGRSLLRSAGGSQKAPIVLSPPPVSALFIRLLFVLRHPADVRTYLCIHLPSTRVLSRCKDITCKICTHLRANSKALCVILLPGYPFGRPPAQCVWR